MYNFKELLKSLEDFKGVPFKYLGNDKEGIDCAGLAMRAFKNAFGIKIGRNALEMFSNECFDKIVTLNESDLKSGDILLFAVNYNDETGDESPIEYSEGMSLEEVEFRHIEIYIGDNKTISTGWEDSVKEYTLDFTNYFISLRLKGGILDEK